MKEPPAFLPKANSRKWHGRNLMSLGYFRVRSLANPQWQRDVNDVLRHIKAHRFEFLDDRSKELLDATRREELFAGWKKAVAKAC